MTKRPQCFFFPFCTWTFSQSSVISFPATGQRHRPTQKEVIAATWTEGGGHTRLNSPLFTDRAPKEQNGMSPFLSKDFAGACLALGDECTILSLDTRTRSSTHAQSHTGYSPFRLPQRQEEKAVLLLNAFLRGTPLTRHLAVVKYIDAHVTAPPNALNVTTNGSTNREKKKMWQLHAHNIHGKKNTET